MRLKSSIFLWVSLATIIPLTALVLGITAYSEQLNRKNVDADIEASMQSIISEINFHLKYEQDVILSLATSPTMKSFFPVLEMAAKGDLHPDYFEEVEKLNQFLAGFQHSVPGLDTMRVLDLDGNSLIKVRFGQHLPALFEGMEDVPLIEEELTDEHFLNWMRQLKPYKLVYGELPLSRRDFKSGQELSLLNSIVPLAKENEDRPIGFLTARAMGDQIDRLLQSMPRSHHFKIHIVELNLSNPTRHGMLLYSDTLQLNFNQPHMPDWKLSNRVNGSLWKAVETKRFGTFFHSTDEQRYYFQEFYPYNNQLVSWVIVLQLDNSELAAPFQRIRIGLFAFAFMALIISLVLANLGARHIARPITEFSRGLKNYADGEAPLQNIQQQSTTELQQLDQSFHYLVDSLEQTQEERDRAQHMMLQTAKLASIGEMAAGIGHEINNPLNNILSLSKLIERDINEKDEEMLNDVQALRKETLRASRIVKGILNFARQVPPEYSQFDLHQWLDDTVQLVMPEAKKLSVNIQINPPPETIIQGDRQQLQQVLVNLLSNALHVSQPGQTIQIRARLLDDHIEIIVSDEGRGISEEDQDKIFDPFFTTQDVGEGSGLGLSISLGIVQSHHGKLELHNNDRGGVDAVITLPYSPY